MRAWPIISARTRRYDAREVTLRTNLRAKQDALEHGTRTAHRPPLALAVPASPTAEEPDILRLSDSALSARISFAIQLRNCR